MRGRNAILGVAGVVGLSIALGIGWFLKFGNRTGEPADAEANANANASAPEISAAEVAQRIGEGNPEALATFRDHLIAVEADGRPIALTEEAADDCAGLMDGAARGYRKFGTVGRAMIAGMAGCLLERLAVEPAPGNWSKALGPIHQVIDVALHDPEVQVRGAALAATSKVWNWAPGRTALPVEEAAIGPWKDAFTGPVSTLLADPEPQIRAAAVLNLAMVPLDSVAEPAAARIRDKAPEVRRQALSGFARRPGVLTEEDILERLYDEDPSMRLLARTVLDQRGLSEEQIELGSQVFNPDPTYRQQVIGKLNGRDDIDPIVWLIHLSRDKNEGVRAEAIGAMRARATAPEVVQRLTEMAVKDPSKAIRAEARKLLPAEAAAVLPQPGDDVTVSVPPLPGSSTLKPRAN